MIEKAVPGNLKVFAKFDALEDLPIGARLDVIVKELEVEHENGRHSLEEHLIVGVNDLACLGVNVAVDALATGLPAKGVF